MGIGSVSMDSAGDYTSILRDYKVPVISGAASEKLQAQNAPAQAEAASAVIAVPEAVSAGRQDISLTFNRQESFGYIGRDRDIHSLDVEKAINDMKKDKILQQYQYFVGSSRDLYGAEDADGMVIRKL